MNDDLVILLALDSLLVEVDDDYENIPKEKYDLIQSKVLESYGLSIDSSDDEIYGMKKYMLADIYKYRDKLIDELKKNK